MDKAYNQTSKDYDPAEREEETNRMREMVFNSIDSNNDSMISLEEFLGASQKKEFTENKEWKVPNLYKVNNFFFF